VKSKGANPWGLYDMLGNVWEWCEDTFAAYTAASSTDPIATGGSGRVSRGGSWFADARDVRAASRFAGAPSFRHVFLGLRLARARGWTGRPAPDPTSAASVRIGGRRNPSGRQRGSSGCGRAVEPSLVAHLHAEITVQFDERSTPCLAGSLASVSATFDRRSADAPSRPAVNAGVNVTTMASRKPSPVAASSAVDDHPSRRTVRPSTMETIPATSSPPTTKARPNAFGSFVRARREELGITQDAVGTAVLDARASIANIERGGRPPYEDPARIRVLAAVLQTDADALVKLAAENRADYVLSGAGPGVTNAHRELALLLEQGWGRFGDATLARALVVVEKAPPIDPSKESSPSPFGKWLLATRLAKDLSQSALAKVGLARSYLSMVETGEKGASFPDEKFVAIVAMLGGDLMEVRALVARSRQFYKVESRIGEPDEVSLPHRRLAAALVARWHTLPGKTLAKVRAELAVALQS
jgi:transcriptional regulator with XRE-family HTH domain